MADFVMALRELGLTEMHLVITILILSCLLAFVRYYRGVWPFGDRPLWRRAPAESPIRPVRKPAK